MSELRLLVACDACGRQYDASQRPQGSRFRCSCGEVLTVPRPDPHEAAVVRCSACGAPRQGEAPTCAYCGSDFTLRERDLDTLCPHCGARVSGRGRFCHSCGQPVLAGAAAGESTELACPSCEGEQRLVSRRLGELTALECGRCAGLWIDNEAFRLLAERARQGEVPAGDHGGLPVGSMAAEAPAGRLYRPCPRCGKLMHRRNYARRSGVIVDQCKEHGVWFDADELERVLEWIRRGGLTAKAEWEAEEQREREKVERLRGAGMSPYSGLSEFDPPSRHDPFAALTELIGGALRLFGH
jgi:Zn-finger nucleic acid-binding protein